MEDNRYTLHSVRKGAENIHLMDGTVMDVLMEYVGWRSAAIDGGYVGVLAYAATSRGALSAHAAQRS